MKNTFILIVVVLIQSYSMAQNEPVSNYVYSQEDTLKGQIETANRLKYYIDNELYDQAISLFSESQQQNISKFRDEEEKFQYWIYAWELTDEKYKRYISKIKQGKGHFVFENKMWKIDER